MIINFYNEKKLKDYKDKLTVVFEQAMATLGVCKDIVEVNVTAVSRHEIKKLNREYRGIDKVTDVLSFPNLVDENNDIITIIDKKMYPNDINPENGAIMLGDTYICMPQAYSQAKLYGNTREREVCYLLIHSLLHLMGYDHMQDDDKKLMREKEEEILSAQKIVRE